MVVVVGLPAHPSLTLGHVGEEEGREGDAISREDKTYESPVLRLADPSAVHNATYTALLPMGPIPLLLALRGKICRA